MTPKTIAELNHQFDKSSPEEVLSYAIEKYGDKLVLASSLGVEDQVLTNMLNILSDEVSIFVLDTGRLPQETYDVMARTMHRYAFNYAVYYPDQQAVEKMVAENGPNHFYDSIENRKECCGVRKVEPLSRALDGKKAWITGIRRAQSIDRLETELFEWDESHNMIKINPLVSWSKDDVWDYVKRHDIPYNALHDKGYPSIGCAPCTRAVPLGEDDRSGRWWWEEAVQKECGLHVRKLTNEEDDD